MIVVDTSALMAILLGEDDAKAFENAMLEADRIVMSAPNAFELRLAMRKRAGRSTLRDVDLVLTTFNVEIAPWTAAHVAVATDALLRFGGRPARLNYGDCMAYALARALDAPLLFKGDDFRHTDARSA